MEASKVLGSIKATSEVTIIQAFQYAASFEIFRNSNTLDYDIKTLEKMAEMNTLLKI